MNFNKVILIVLMLIPFLGMAQEKKTETPEEEYTRVITGRADKIVDAMEFTDDSCKIRVRDIIVDHYRFLSTMQDAKDSTIKSLREKYAENKELRDALIDKYKGEVESKITTNHYAFCAKLAVEITPEQIDQVKDGLTYNVLNVTYSAHIDMIPTLTDEEKKQIRVWLIEAREHAIDGASSKEKHGWFGKYKGRINNYLSNRGYDLQAEREAWKKRVEERDKAKSENK